MLVPLSLMCGFQLDCCTVLQRNHASFSSPRIGLMLQRPISTARSPATLLRPSNPVTKYLRPHLSAGKFFSTASSTLPNLRCYMRRTTAHQRGFEPQASLDRSQRAGYRCERDGKTSRSSRSDCVHASQVAILPLPVALPSRPLHGIDIMQQPHTM